MLSALRSITNLLNKRPRRSGAGCSSFGQKVIDRTRLDKICIVVRFVVEWVVFVHVIADETVAEFVQQNTAIRTAFHVRLLSTLTAVQDKHGLSPIRKLDIQTVMEHRNGCSIEDRRPVYRLRFLDNRWNPAIHGIPLRYRLQSRTVQ